MYLGIDLGGTKIAAGLVDRDGHVSSLQVQPTDAAGSEEVVKQLVQLLRRYREQGVRAAGIGIPGIAERGTGRVWAPNIPGWDYIPLRSRLAEASGLPVVVESDRNTAVLGELLYGAARGCRDVVYLILGTGIGAGIVSGGRLVRGHDEIAGSVGWVPVSFEGELRHFEEVAAGPAIVRHACRRGLAGTVPELASLAASAHPGAIRLFAEVGSVVGRVLALLVSLLNPQLILLGGGVSRSWQWMKQDALDAMQRWSQPEAVKRVRVQPGSLGLEAGVLGAAAAARLEGGESG
jgi:glucokinase